MLPIHAKELVTFQPGAKADEAVDETKLYVCLGVPTITGRMRYEREMAATGIMPTGITTVRQRFRDGVIAILDEPEGSQMLAIVDKLLNPDKKGDAPGEEVAADNKLTPEESTLFAQHYARMIQEYPPLAEAAADAAFWNDIASMTLARLFLKEIHDPDGKVTMKLDARGWATQETLTALGLQAIRQIGNQAWKLMSLGEDERKN